MQALQQQHERISALKARSLHWDGPGGFHLVPAQACSCSRGGWGSRQCGVTDSTGNGQGSLWVNHQRRACRHQICETRTSENNKVCWVGAVKRTGNRLPEGLQPAYQ